MDNGLFYKNFICGTNSTSKEGTLQNMPFIEDSSRKEKDRRPQLKTAIVPLAEEIKF